MTEKDLEAIESLYKATTPGTWKIEECLAQGKVGKNGKCHLCDRSELVESYVVEKSFRGGLDGEWHTHIDPEEWHSIVTENGVHVTGNYEEEQGGVCSSRGDAEFIARSHQLVPVLVAEIRQLKEEIARLKAEK